MSEIFGIIIPLPKELIDRFLSEKKNVLLKYTSKNGSSKLLRKDRVLFYVSHSSKEIIGEGKIDEIYTLTPKERECSSLFLNFINIAYVPSQSLQKRQNKFGTHICFAELVFLAISNYVL